MIIVRDTLRWTGEKGVWIEPAEIERDDFKKWTGLEPRQISTALANALELGIIVREDRKGKPSLWAAVPEAFADLERREARVVAINAGREKSANTQPKESEEKPTKPASTHAIEPASAQRCYCAKCGEFSVIEPVSEAEAEQPAQERPPRAGPTRETGRKKTKTEEIIERLKRKLTPNYA
jgi:hypothetical protein